MYNIYHYVSFVYNAWYEQSIEFKEDMYVFLLKSFERRITEEKLEVDN